MIGNLLILGAGQYGMLAKEIAESMKCYEKIDFLDDNNEIAIGKLQDYSNFVSEYPYAVVAIGNPEIRLNLIRKLEQANYKIATLISPMAYISPTAKVMHGSIIEPCAVVQTDAVVSKGVIISSGAVVRHNAFVGEGCHCDCGSVVMTNSKVPSNLKICCNEVYK